jgi:hypothetical protein
VNREVGLELLPFSVVRRIAVESHDGTYEGVSCSALSRSSFSDKTQFDGIGAYIGSK